MLCIAVDSYSIVLWVSLCFQSLIYSDLKKNKAKKHEKLQILTLEKLENKEYLAYCMLSYLND